SKAAIFTQGGSVLHWHVGHFYIGTNSNLRQDGKGDRLFIGLMSVSCPETFDKLFTASVRATSSASKYVASSYRFLVFQQR
ncbi:hypothetical protein, partial [Rouxiella badensis]|uniref:hypothetical protein n=1 Tax=Rouxiella badensis TaxID=1646377 RepID=UPI003A5BD807